VLEGKLIHLGLFDPEKGLDITVIYRDGDRCAWAKRTTISSFIKDREYDLIKDRDGRVDHLIFGAPVGTATAQFAPAKGQRVHEAQLDLKTLESVGTGARGVRIGDKSTTKVVLKQG
jgi:hypothetical protein